MTDFEVGLAREVSLDDFCAIWNQARSKYFDGCAAGMDWIEVFDRNMFDRTGRIGNFDIDFEFFFTHRLKVLS